MMDECVVTDLTSILRERLAQAVEDERAACEILALAAIEKERKACEEIARDKAKRGDSTVQEVADAIAARKAKPF
jgi:hypothetical protein